MGRHGAYEQKNLIVKNIALNMLAVCTDAEVAGGLWVHGLWRDKYPGSNILVVSSHLKQTLPF